MAAFISPAALLEAARVMAVEEARASRLRPIHPGTLVVRPSHGMTEAQGLAALAAVFRATTTYPFWSSLTWTLDDTGVWASRGDCETLPAVPRTEQGELHCVDGPALDWQACPMYFLRGVHVPGSLYYDLMAGQLTVRRVLALTNEALLSVLMERLGWEDALSAKGVSSVVLDDHERWGRLIRVTTMARFEREYTLLRVVNRSPEPDGSYRQYWLQVHSELRPLLPSGGMGTPQEMTSLCAVASTFGMTGEEYEQIVGDES